MAIVVGKEWSVFPAVSFSKFKNRRQRQGKGDDMSAFAHHALLTLGVRRRERDMRFRSRDERREKLCAALEAEEWIEQDSGILCCADVRLNSRLDPSSSFARRELSPLHHFLRRVPTTADQNDASVSHRSALPTV